jgi:PAS domain S-box-containing protein
MADILLLLSDSAHSAPLRAACGTDHTVLETDHLSPGVAFDLCVADAPAFLANLTPLRAIKSADGLLFTPILVLARPEETDVLAPHVGTLIDDLVALTGEPLTSALRQMVLRARVKHLLLGRKVSARLARDLAARAAEQETAIEEQRRARLAALNLMQDAQIAQARTEQALARSRESEAILALQARRAQALLALPPAAETMGEKEFIQWGKELAKELTGSRLAFITFLQGSGNPTESLLWSDTENPCRFPDAPDDCALKHARMWAEALQQRTPVIVNDFSGHAVQQTLPEGQPPLRRLVVVPVIENHQVVLLAGIANKEAEYTDFDVETLQLIADMLWHTVQRKHAMQALRESEERYRLVTENSNDVIWLYSLADDTLTYVSPSVTRMTGYAPAEAIALGIEGLLTPDSARRARALIAETVAAFSRGDTSGRIQRHEFQQHHRDGGDVATEMVATLITDAAGIPTHIQGVSRDMTARKTAEQALRRSNELLQSVLESVPVRVFWKDSDLRYVGCNSAFARDAGVGSPADLIGRTDLDLAWKAEAELYRADDRRVIASGQPKLDYEEPQTSPTGQTIWLRTSKVPMRGEHGEVVGVLGAYQDITESKRIQDQARKLAQAVEQSAESIVITNVAGDIDYVNESFVRLSGYSREEVVGRNPRLLQSGRTPADTYLKMWARLSAGQAWKGEFHNRRKDGSEFVEFALVSPIRNSEGRITHYVAVKEDITEKKRIAVELDRHRFHLEELIEQRTQDLRAATAAAQAATVAKSAFIANMSHEIRTPLNAIIGLAHLMRRAGVAPHQVEQLDKIDRAARHLLSLINDILDFSKIEAGKLQLEEVVFSPAAILGNVVSLVSEQAQAKKVEIVTDTGRLPDAVRSDPTRLTQSLLNLVANAIKFTDRGTVTIRTRQLVAEGDDVRLQFEVHDTGIGIPAEVLARLFMPFEQADPSTTRKHGGTGLGLAITRRYAELMGGTVEARSVPGQGSTFVLTVRLKPADGEGATQSLPERTAEHTLARDYRGARILLVEDDPINQEVALELLRSVGLSADLAEDGAAAIARYQAAAGDYALILMDVRMPVMDGLAATRQIRTLPGGDTIPIVAMTANAFAEDRIQCTASGMNDFVAKPVDPDLLFSIIHKWLLRNGVACPAPPTPVAGAHPDPEETELLRLLAAVEGLDSKRGLRTMRGNVVSYAVLLRRFAETHGLDAGLFAKRLADGDMSEARRVAHSLKGAAASVGATGIESLAAKLEAAVLAQDAPAIDALVGPLNAEIERVRAGIWSALPPETGAKTDVIEWAALQGALEQLERLLRRGDMRANSIYRDVAPMIRAVLAPRADQMERLLGNFNYEGALDLLPKIRAELSEAQPAGATR